MPASVTSGVEVSPCENYRYLLWKTWDAKAPRMLFIGLNPSLALSDEGNPTMQRCLAFAKSWGYGGVYLANLFAWRSPDPRGLLAAQEPIGPDNDAWLVKLAGQTDLQLAAWGNHGAHLGRSLAVRKLLPDLHCLKINRSGEPAHPLYLRASLRPQPLGNL
ncbi:DUF1643 domain-containing protein [Marinospirillum perlucidum]|uniref:DUF1643 domain-containing protein n=1 Tax=Marinospirillum perlucidum TaxID=1982602 RepID=UPI001C49BD4A|nr:DUF1643 domain-containing protein [Marinospirillum perlucidum]